MVTMDVSATAPAAMSSGNRKERVGALTNLVIGSMVGSGVFSLPQNMAAGAGPLAILIGWGITAVGMLALVFVYQSLATRKPQLDAGPYAYAKAGFGPFIGFNSAWGYWISAWIGNVSYAVRQHSGRGAGGRQFRRRGGRHRQGLRQRATRPPTEGGHAIAAYRCRRRLFGFRHSEGPRDESGQSGLALARKLSTGSMGPKIAAAAGFADATGRPAAIGRLDDALAIVRGELGTWIDRSIPPSGPSDREQRPL